MKKIEMTSQLFVYQKRSHTGNYYDESFTVTITNNGFVIIHAGFSLREVLNSCLEDLTKFVVETMSKYKLGVTEFEPRVNRGNPPPPINPNSWYYKVDGKLYRCDKRLRGEWRAPASDLLRLLFALKNGTYSPNNLGF